MGLTIGMNAVVNPEPQRASYAECLGTTVTIPRRTCPKAPQLDSLAAFVNQGPLAGLLPLRVCIGTRGAGGGVPVPVLRGVAGCGVPG